jgi:tripartite ATP-independent transporter DctM subunit
VSPDLLAAAGLALFPLIAGMMILTGMPAYMALIGAAGIGAITSVSAGNGAILGALPNRIVSLLEGDLLQALPLFVTMGALINRLPLANILFRAGQRLIGGGRAQSQAAGPSALILGALFAPMNGSVGASVAMLSRGVRPMLAGQGVPVTRRTALIAAASTIGVVVPPSLVLIFLGDAMMGAHTVALNATRRVDQVINSQDVFRAVLVPAGFILVLWMAIAWFGGRHSTANGPSVPSLSPMEWLVAGSTVVFIVVLLGGVAMGAFYAVEAAAMGCVSLLAAGFASGKLSKALLSEALGEALALSGALFALLLAATTFTLVVRVMGTDRLLTDMIAALPGGETLAVMTVLAVIMVCAFVLDAFEIVFVIIPIVMPGLLMRANDTAWVAALVLLTLQVSFLLPPFGYAVMMARGSEPEASRTGALVRALSPFLAAQALVILGVLVFPAITHVLDPPRALNAPTVLSDEEVRRKFDDLMPTLPAPSVPELR